VARLDDLLEKTSRTLALSIPPLPERLAGGDDRLRSFSGSPTRSRMRITGRPESGLRRSGNSRSCSRRTSPEKAVRVSRAWSAAQPANHEGYIELIAEVPFVLEAFFSALKRTPSSRSARRRPLLGRDGRVRLADARGTLSLGSVEELKRYCYYVAGIVARC